MKKVLIIIFALFIMLLTACNMSGTTKEIEHIKIEELFNRKHDILLIENDDIKLKLINARHERGSDGLDAIELSFEMTNKQNRTFEYNFRNMQLDGHRDVTFGMNVHEIEPSETMILKMSVIGTEQLSFYEYISGELHYNDYSRDVLSAIKMEFSTYIN